MTVHFIGAGPGSADLVTVRGHRLIATCPVCLYAGSLIPQELVALCPPEAKVLNTATMDLDEIVAACVEATEAGLDVARLHSGDLSIWSAMGEQLRRLRAANIPLSITPGVPSFSAAAAALEVELTLPALTQSVILTRTPGRASQMPPREQLEVFASTGALLAIHLSIHTLAEVVATLRPHYGDDCPAAIAYRVSWPDERLIRATLGTLVEVMDPQIDRTALILVGPTLAANDFQNSALYSAGYPRRFRPSATPEQNSGNTAGGRQ